MSENVVEIVRFKLYDYADEAQFMQSNEAMISFLQNQPGFIYRSLVKDEQTSEWSDIVYWEDLAKAETAGKAFMESENTRAMIKYIDNNSVKIQHLPVKWQYYPEMQQNAS